MPASLLSPAWLLSLTALLLGSAAQPARAYQIVERDGAVLEVDEIGALGGRHVARVGETSIELADLEVDWFRTWHANLGEEGGNVLLLRNGGRLCFEDGALEGGRLTLLLAEGQSISIDETRVDYRRTILEAATLTLDEDDRRGILTAKEKPRYRRPLRRGSRRRR